MFNTEMSYVARATRQRKKRLEQKLESSHILNKTDSHSTSSDDSNIDIADEDSINIPNNIQIIQDEDLHMDYSNLNPVTYEPDDDDNYSNESLVHLVCDSSSPLYANSHVSVKAAAASIMSMATDFNFSKAVVERMLKIFKSLLPIPNTLPTTQNSLIKTIGVVPASSSKYYCNSCLELCKLQSGKKICENVNCRLKNQSLRNRDISELVNMDIKAQLKTIILRNISLLRDTKFSYPFDIKSSAFYKTKRSISESNTINNKPIYPITLVIHTDGAPLVRTTKSCLWPCLASIVELPPQIREEKNNILVLCLWASSIKPDVNLFMNDCINQLHELSDPFTLVVNNLEFSIKVNTQFFISDLPAKALMWKTINHNGYNACTYCVTEGVCQNRQVFYPYNRNNYQQWTHEEYLITARTADQRVSNKKKGGSIDGIKGLSPLFQIFEYPKQIIFDYMHLCCLGHVSTLIKRWLSILNGAALADINLKLFSQKFPHDMSVKFNYTLNTCGDWKAKHFRVFILSIGLPIMYSYLPPLVASHFALYSMFIKLLHCPKSLDEIQLADKIIHYYCKIAPEIYGGTIEIFSLHAHLHLPQQVITHGGLCFTSAFCFESALRHLKKKAHGTRNLATQIADWINIETVVTQSSFQVLKPVGVNNININDSIFDGYRYELLNLLRTFNQNEDDAFLFLRFKDSFVTYHSKLYDLPFDCASYVISYTSMDSLIKYGQVIIFVKHEEDYYAFIQEYKSTEKKMSDYVSVPDELQEKLNEIFPVRKLSNSFALIPVISICHKCIQIEYKDHVFLSEVRADFEHD